LAVLQTVAPVSFQVTDRLSIGVAPVVDAMLGGFDPAFFAPLSGIGLQRFPSATGGRLYWGGGFKAGAYYHLFPNVDVGFGYSSPQWFENLVWNSRDSAGNPVTVTLPMQLPAIYSAGVGVKATEKLLLAADCRLIDNINSVPFGQAPAAGGLGWQEVLVAAVGMQYQFSPRFSARVGYSYNTPTFPGTFSLFNVQAPSVTQHVVSAGVSMRIAENVYSSLAYAYSVRNTVSGSAFQIPGGGTSITADVHTILLTMTVKFGTPSRNPAEAPDSAANSGPAITTQPLMASSLTSMSPASGQNPQAQK
jgi:long-subunit fatty acid transport protein